VKSELWKSCFKGLQVADAELDLDLNRLHETSLYRCAIFAFGGDDCERQPG
jgi:hypothetical protein